MNEILKKIAGGIKNFFRRMTEQEAERIIHYYSQIIEAEPAKGGGVEKNKGKS